MRFTTAHLDGDLDRLRADAAPEDWAFGDNIAFEERVSAARRRDFEDVADPDHTALMETHQLYLENSVRKENAADVATFHQWAKITRVEDIGDDETLVHIEPVSDAVDNLYGDFADNLRALREAIAESRHSDDLLDSFLHLWLDDPCRDARPVFAAPYADVAAAADASDWPRQLAARLGMDDFVVSGSNLRHEALVQVRYRAGEVRRAYDAWPACFAAPTVLDTRPGPVFAPSPQPACATSWAGRTVDLNAQTEGAPVREILHPPFRWQAKHVYAMCAVPRTTAPDWSTTALKQVRNDHIKRVRTVTARPDFGDMR